jgi:hypothetical protein
MGRKTLLAAALAAALAGLAACGTQAGTSNATGPARATSTSSTVAAPPSPPHVVASTGRLPAGIHAVRITLVPGANDRTKPPGPVTVTSPAEVGTLVALVNGLKAFPAGSYSCPMDDGRGVRLAFLGQRAGATLATAFAAGNGCGGVTLTAGTRKSVLGWGDDAAKRALAIAGIHWNVQG